MAIQVNRNGFLVQFNDRKGGGDRTYACADEDALDHLLKRLTGRGLSTFARSLSGGFTFVNDALDISVCAPLHIYREEA